VAQQATLGQRRARQLSRASGIFLLQPWLVVLPPSQKDFRASRQHPVPRGRTVWDGERTNRVCSVGSFEWKKFPNDLGKCFEGKMGGSGSGRRFNSRSTTCDYHALDVRRWQRERLLVPGRSFIAGWWKVEITTLLNNYDKPARLVLSHMGYPTRHRVWLSWSRCNYGNSRPWFVCPARGCGHRVAILFYGARGFLACRHCFDLAYPSEQESKWHRSLHKAQAIRNRLGGSGSLVDPFPNRPKGMHRRTYRRLYAKAAVAEGASFARLEVVLHTLQSRKGVYE
jgi:hypothetical protein